MENRDEHIGRTIFEDVIDGHVERVGRRLSDGEAVGQWDGTGNTLLHYAVIGEPSAKPAMVKLLLDAGADVNATNAFRESPLHHVANIGDRATARTLIDRGANTTLQDEAGKTAAARASDESRNDFTDHTGRWQDKIAARSSGSRGPGDGGVSQ